MSTTLRTNDDVDAVFGEVVRHDREWIAGEPSVKRVTTELVDGARIRVSAKKVEVRGCDSKTWHDVSDAFPREAKS